MRVRKDKRQKGEESRERIAKVAIQLFAKEGFSRASIQSIADACELSQSAVLYHFPTKEHLVEAVIGRIVIHNHEIVTSAITMHDSALERIEKHFEQNLAWAVDFREEAQIIILLYYLSCVEKRFSVLYSKILVAARSRMAEYLWAGKREKVFPADLNAELVAEILHDALLGGIINVITQTGQTELAKKVPRKWKHFIARITEAGKNAT